MEIPFLNHKGGRMLIFPKARLVLLAVPKTATNPVDTKRLP